MAKFGNSGVSSLLSAANAAATRQRTYNDSIQGYQFDLSAKSPEDFKAYQDYLNGRAKQETDPTKQLALQKTLTTAYRSFNSSEITRQTMAVKYGDQSNRDKYANMVGLYHAALQNGDDNLAQSLDSQLASLSVTIQNEDNAKAAAGAAASSKAQSALNSGYTKAITEQKQLMDQYKADLGSGAISAKQYNDLVAGTDSPFAKIQALYDQAQNDSGLSSDNQAKFLDDANKFKTDNQSQSALLDKAKFESGNTPAAVQYDESTGQYKYTPLKQTGVAQRLDDKGNIVGVPITGPANGAPSDLSKVKPGDGFNLLQNARTGQRGVDANGQPLPLSPSQAVIKHYTVDENGNPMYINHDTGGTIQVATQQKGSDSIQSDVIQPNANADYGLIQGSDGKYRFSTAKDFKPGIKGVFADNPVLNTIAKAGKSIQWGKIGTSLASSLPGSILANTGSMLNNIVNRGAQAKAKADAQAKLQASLQQSAALAAQRDAEARRALAAIPAAKPTVPVAVVGNKVVNAPSIYKVPAAVTQAQNTVGSQSFTQKYLPVAGKLGF